MKNLKTLSEACTPRQSVFDRSRKDVVLHLGDLLSGKLGEKEADTFFAENFVTKGLKSLVNKTFERLSGKKDQASTFLLSQAMGRGKTHSMIALGLLAKYPALRKKYWTEGELGNQAIRVIGFDGRESDYPFGTWGALAEQVGNKELFKDLYSPLQAPAGRHSGTLGLSLRRRAGFPSQPLADRWRECPASERTCGKRLRRKRMIRRYSFHRGGPGTRFLTDRLRRAKSYDRIAGYFDSFLKWNGKASW